MSLKAIHDTLEEIPEQYRELYSERDGKYELTGISGIKTTADVDRVQTALTKEREDHKATKTKLSAWGELDPEEVHGKLDRIDELEAAAADKIDDEKLNEMAEARVKSRVAPLEREIAQLKKENETLTGQVGDFQSKDRTRSIHDAVRKVATEMKVVGTAMDDILLQADRVFDITEDGAILTKDNVGVTPSSDPQLWLTEMQEKRPHWWPAAQGGGARGSGSGGGVASNPWAKDNWSLTKQGEYVKEHGMEKAQQAAKLAGSAIGATSPPADK